MVPACNCLVCLQLKERGILQQDFPTLDKHIWNPPPFRFSKGGQNFPIERKGFVKEGVCSKKGGCVCVLLIYTISISILFVPQEGIILVESNQQIYDFYK